MNDPVISVISLTRDYGSHKGVFDVSFDVKSGEVFGFIGPNGAGKTTTIRHLLGFLKPESGACTVCGYDAWKEASRIHERLGYLPGEMTFFDHMTGTEFLKLLADLRGLKDFSYMEELLHFFDLDPQGSIRKMSKGMKQKLGLVSAFMHDPDVLILDEPTSGLDPLMQTKFVELVLKEKQKKKTILMSSHSFEEIERTCDRAGIIKEGVLVAVEDIALLKQTQRKAFIIRLKDKASMDHLIKAGFDMNHQRELDVELSVSGDIQPLINTLATIHVESIDIKKQSLEEIFMDYYRQEQES